MQGAAFSRRPGHPSNRGRIATTAGVASPIGEWAPASIGSAVLFADYDTRNAATYGTTLRDFSGTGPVITIAGTLTTPWRVEIAATGGRGVGKIRVSSTSGRTYVTPEDGVTIPADGIYAIPGSGDTLTFAASSFTVGRLYGSFNESLVDASGNGYTLTRNTSAGLSGPIMIEHGRSACGFTLTGQCRGVGGRKALVSNATEVMENASLAAALFGGTDKAFHVFFVGRLNNIAGGGAQTLVGASKHTAGFPYRELIDSGTGHHTQVASNNDANAATTTTDLGDASDVRDHVYEFSFDPTSGGLLETRRDGVLIGSRTGAFGTATGLTRFTVLGLLISNTTFSKAVASFSRILTYGGKLSAPDAATARAQLAAIHHIRLSRAIRAAHEGDSYPANAQGENAYPNVLFYSNNVPTVVNAAAIGSGVAGCVTRASTVDANYSAGAYANILVINVGGNDLGLDGSGDESALRTSLANYITARKAVGWHVILFTIIPRGDGSGGAEPALALSKRNAQNAWRVSGGSGANRVIDINAVWAGVPGDGVWYQADGLHPSRQGASLFATLLETEMELVA